MHIYHYFGNLGICVNFQITNLERDPLNLTLPWSNDYHGVADIEGLINKEICDIKAVLLADTKIDADKVNECEILSKSNKRSKRTTRPKRQANFNPQDAEFLEQAIYSGTLDGRFNFSTTPNYVIISIIA